METDMNVKIVLIRQTMYAEQDFSLKNAKSHKQ